MLDSSMEEESVSKTNLIINYLPPNLSDEEFRSMFLNLGPIRSAKVVRDKSTGYSLGYGFVDYQTETDAHRAIETFNGLQMDTKRLKVALAKKDAEESNSTNIYVKNIPKEYTEKELNAVFEPYGKIVTSKVLIDLQTGESRTVGFVQYSSREESDRAIEALNARAPPGSAQPLYLKYADDGKKNKSPQMQNPMSPQYSTGWYGVNANRFPSPTPGQGGPMRNPAASRFRYNPMGGATAGLGVTGQAGFTAQTTSFSNGGATSPMEVPKGPGPYVIFVYNIGPDAEERELWALFSPYGSVQKVNVMYDHAKNQCKGFGFVTMTNLHEATNAINCLHNSLYKGRQLSVSFKK